MQRARLIPTSGIGSEKEAEQRATSALLAVLTVVRDLSVDLFGSLGASRAQRATVEAFTEVSFTSAGKTVRPDGLVRISFGKNTWSALVEVKTGEARLAADQLNAYWDVARSGGIDHIVTISNEIAPNQDTHPTEGLKVRANSKVPVTHLSWTAILTAAVRLKQHVGVDDPEQAFILGELIRYLEHPASGALAFSDMGPNWVGIRDAVRSGAATKRDDGVEDIAARWDQLLRYAALKLSSDIGEDVTVVLSKAHRDSKVRVKHLVDCLCGDGAVDGALRIPHTAGDVDLLVDLRAQQLTTAMNVDAPGDKGAVGRVSWLVNQLPEARADLVIEAYPKNARTPTTATLGQVRDDRAAVLDDKKREPYRFRLVARRPVGTNRKAGGKSPGFIDSVLTGIDDFYGNVVQNVTPWVAPAPKLQRPARRDDADADTTGEPSALNPPVRWESSPAESQS